MYKQDVVQTNTKITSYPAGFIQFINTENYTTEFTKENSCLWKISKQAII